MTWTGDDGTATSTRFHVTSVADGRAIQIRSRSTAFGQVGFEPGQVPIALKPAFYLGFCVPY
jgi:hypothetical protein